MYNTQRPEASFISSKKPFQTFAVSDFYITKTELDPEVTKSPFIFGSSTKSPSVSPSEFPQTPLSFSDVISKPLSLPWATKPEHQTSLLADQLVQYDIKSQDPAHFVNMTVFYKESPDVLAALPQHFLPVYKSFCWYNKDENFLCLPSVYIAGFPKCGTTDFYSKLVWHPEFVKPAHSKEYFYWSRSRLGKRKTFVQPGDGKYESFTEFAASFGGKALILDTNNTKGRLVDGSQNIMWDQIGWKDRNPGANMPPYSYADVIHRITPHAKVIVLVRDPVERLYSEYLFLDFVKQRRLRQKTGVSRDSFGQEVAEDTARFQQCLETNTLEHCCFEQKEGGILRIYIGVYICYLKDWYELFTDNIFILFLDDYSRNPLDSMLEVYNFMGAALPNINELQTFIFNSKIANSRRKNEADKGDMSDETRILLRNFYRPFNQQLAEYFNNSKFLFYDHRSINDKVVL